MVDINSSSVGGQAFQQPINNTTFQPGRNVEQRETQERTQKQGAEQTDRVKENADAFTQARAKDTQEKVQAGQTENNPQAQRGALVDLTV